MLCVKNYYSIWPSYRKDGMPFVTQCSSNQTRYIFRETYRYGGIIKRMKYEKTSQGSFSSVQAVDWSIQPFICKKTKLVFWLDTRSRHRLGDASNPFICKPTLKENATIFHDGRNVLALAVLCLAFRDPFNHWKTAISIQTHMSLIYKWHWFTCLLIL